MANKSRTEWQDLAFNEEISQGECNVAKMAVDLGLEEGYIAKKLAFLRDVTHLDITIVGGTSTRKTVEEVSALSAAMNVKLAAMRATKAEAEADD